MRALLVVIAVVSALWSGYWFIGAKDADRGLEQWLAQRHPLGWTLRYDALNTSGFPNRFDTTLDSPKLAIRESDLFWEAPFLQVFRLSYQPKHVIVVWPNQQALTRNGQTYEIDTQDAQGSFVFSGPNWGLERASLAIDELRVKTNGGLLAIDSLRLATRPSERLTGAIDIGVTANAPSINGHALDLLHLDLSLSSTAAWDRDAVEIGLPRVTEITVHRALLSWGEAWLELTGDIRLDGSGSGRLEATLYQPETLYRHLEAASLSVQELKDLRTGAKVNLRIQDHAISVFERRIKVADLLDALRL